MYHGFPAMGADRLVLVGSGSAVYLEEIVGPGAGLGTSQHIYFQSSFMLLPCFVNIFLVDRGGQSYCSYV